MNRFLKLGIELAGASAGAYLGAWVGANFVVKSDTGGFIVMKEGWGLDDIALAAVVGTGAMLGLKLAGKVGG